MHFAPKTVLTAHQLDPGTNPRLTVCRLDAHVVTPLSDPDRHDMASYRGNESTEHRSTLECVRHFWISVPRGMGRIYPPKLCRRLSM